MKIEFHIEGAASAAAFAAFLPQYQAALKADEETWRAARAADGNVAFGIESAAPAPEQAPVAAEPEKPKRGRPAKAAEPVKEPEPAIRATPEDRQPVDAIEDAEVVSETPAPKVYSREDLRAALADYVEVVGMAKANETKGALLGYPKFSEVPEDAKAFEAAIVRIREAIEKEKAIND